jgi:hypothetical protein
MESRFLMTTTEADKDMDSARAHPSRALHGAHTEAGGSGQGATLAAIALIIDREAFSADPEVFATKHYGASPVRAINVARDLLERRQRYAIVKAEAILALTGEEFLEFKEALSDLRSLRQEHRDLTGGGPDWNTRWEAAWAKADDLFADEDEAAWERAQEDAHG